MRKKINNKAKGHKKRCVTCVTHLNNRYNFKYINLPKY